MIGAMEAPEHVTTTCAKADAAWLTMDSHGVDVPASYGNRKNARRRARTIARQGGYTLGRFRAVYLGKHGLFHIALACESKVQDNGVRYSRAASWYIVGPVGWSIGIARVEVQA